MVLDSAFSSLYDLMMELVDVYKIRLPKFTVKSLSLSMYVRMHACVLVACIILFTGYHLSFAHRVWHMLSYTCVSEGVGTQANI